ncbi:PREDICTED: protein FREE1 [Drosophila arizonae]|uniref:Protein FREE1 n=1 Tax=Drosophila arizonae TaxID=7263 RepID=A0ABM1PBE8_DROAR|nr:PREDICTED: protein FREE1 [Drosophila arizonae]
MFGIDLLRGGYVNKPSEIQWNQIAERLTFAAPSTEKEEQAVRVYPISEEQYERLLQITDGNNLISEGRLTTAGFASVRNTLGSGWQSLLRIVGFTPTRTDQPKIDIDGQPLCVMRRNVYDAESLSVEGKSANGEESVINCIVVLKRDPALQSLSSSNPDFAPYWYNEQSEEQQQQPAELNFAPEAEQQLERVRATTTTIAPKNKNKNKKRARPSLKSVYAVAAPRQYGSPYGPPAPPLPQLPPPQPPVPQLPPPQPPVPAAPYGSAYGGAYPFPSYGQYNPYAAYSQQLPFSPQSAFGQQPYPYSPQYYGQSPYYNPLAYYEQQDKEEDDIDEDNEDEEYGHDLHVDSEDEDYYE